MLLQIYLLSAEAPLLFGKQPVIVITMITSLQNNVSPPFFAVGGLQTKMSMHLVHEKKPFIPF